MELGGPEVGRGCGGRGIIHGFELLEKLGFHEWGFDYVLLDFLGDVVCGGFGLPIARDMCQKVIVVGSNDLQSLYVANNVCSAVEYFRKLGGNVGVAGMVINKDDGTGEAAAFAEAVGIPILAVDPGRRGHPQEERELRDHRHARRALGLAVRDARRRMSPTRRRYRPTPLTQDGLLGLFKGEVVGRGVVLEPATIEDMCGSVRRRQAVPRSRLRQRLTQAIATACHLLDRRDASCRRPTLARRDRRCRTSRRRASDGLGCHAGKDAMLQAAPMPPARARRSTRTPADYPAGPHDQPQSMCPAFGSLRVGLRMRRTATILSGSACCVYGLTFTSHFYGARRTVGYVPFNSETLVTGKLFEDIREAVFKLADPDDLRRHRHHQSLRADRVRRAAATAAEGDQRRAHHRHRRAGLRRADPCRSQGRAGRRDAAICPQGGRAGAGAGAARRPRANGRRSRCSARCSRPIPSASA